MISHFVSAIVPSGNSILNEAWRSGPEAARSGLWGGWGWLDAPTRFGLGPSNIERMEVGWAAGAMVLAVLAVVLARAGGASAMGRGVPGAGVRRDLRLAAGAMVACAAVVAAMGLTKRTHALAEAMVTLSPAVAVLAALVLIAVLLGRRLGRVDRSACVGCGYPLPEQGGRCPECGHQDAPTSDAAAEVSRPARFPAWFRVLARGLAAISLSLACFHFLGAVVPMPSVLKPSSVVTGINTGASGPAGGLRFVSWRTARAVASPWFVLEGPEWFRVAIVHREQDQTTYACLGFSDDEARVGLMESSFVAPPEGWMEVGPAVLRELLAKGGLGTNPEDEAVIATMLLQMDANFKRGGGQATIPPGATQGKSVVWSPESGRLEPTRFTVFALLTVSLLIGGGQLARTRTRE